MCTDCIGTMRMTADAQASASASGSKWEHVHIDLLNKWKGQCFVDMWLQSESAYMYWRTYNWLSYPVIVLTTCSSAALFSSSALVDSFIVSAIIGSLTTMAALLTTVIRQVKPAELAQTHTLAAKRYQILLRTIDSVVSQPDSLRPDPQDFLHKVQSDMDTLLSSQEEVPLRVKRAFERTYGNLDLLLYGANVEQLIADGAAIQQRLNQLPGAATVRLRGGLTTNGAAPPPPLATLSVNNSPSAAPAPYVAVELAV